MRITTICGSWEEREAVRKLRDYLGNQTVLIPDFPEARPKEFSEKKRLMANHFAKISSSDRVIFVVRDRLGVNTAMELGYAMALGIDVSIVFVGTEMHSVIRTVDELCYFENIIHRPDLGVKDGD